MKRTGLCVARGTLALCALLLVALIAAQIVLIVGINIFSTGRGSAFLSGKINQALENSAYQVAFDALYYDPVRGITVYDLALSDRDGVFLTLDRFSLRPSFAFGPLRTLHIFAQGGDLDLKRRPVAPEDDRTEAGKPLQPFEIPDIYFRELVLSNLSFDRVALGEAIAGAPYVLSPALQAHINLDDAIKVSLTLKPGLPDLAPGLAAPDTLDMTGSFAPSTLDFALDKLLLTAPSYGMSVKGEGSLAGDGTLAMTADIHHDDLTALTKDALQKATAQLSVRGPLTGPALDLDASLITAALKERGLSDIAIAWKTADISQGMTGNVRIETAFQEKPVTLESAVAYDAPTLTLTRIKGDAPALSLTGDGVLSTDTTLFDGKLALSVTDMAQYSELTGMKIGGKLEAQANFTGSESGQQAAQFKLSVANGSFETIKVKNLSVTASLDSLSTPWPQSATLDATALQISSDVALDTIKASIAEQGTQNYKLLLSGSGRAPVALSFDGSAVLSGLTQAIPNANDIALNVKTGTSSVALTGSFTPEQIDLRMSGKDLRATDIPASIPDTLQDVRIDLDAEMTGVPSKPGTRMNAVVRGIGTDAYRDAVLTLKAEHDGDIVTAAATGQGTGIQKLDVQAAFPMALSLLPFNFSFDPSAPLSGTIAADIALQAVSVLFLPPTQTLSGTLTADGTIAGTISQPAPAATLRLAGVEFTDDQNGIFIADLSAQAKIDGAGLSLTALSATDGKNGKLDGTGSLAFGSGDTNISLHLKNFNAPRGNLADGIFDANLSLTGSPDGLRLAGNADIAEMNILIPETFSSNIPQLNIVDDKKDTGPSILERVALDMTIAVDNRFFVRGWGLDAEFGGNITIDGTASAPQFNGTLSSRRGRYEEFGKRFTLARANLRFQGAVPPSPYLDIEATTPSGDVTGSVLLSGPAQSPSITFASTPSLPQDEVLSRILFGKEATKISPFQAVQLAQTIQRFSGNGGGGFDALGTLRAATGLDDISVDTDESGATNLEVGKYLTDNVYLELSKGKAETAGEATIQIEVTPSINIESKIGQDAQGGGGVFWKRDY